MKYIRSQSFHTLNHWQSNKKEEDIYIDYIKRTTNFFIYGLHNGEGVILFPWSLREADAIQGEEWKTSPSLSDTGYYIAPALDALAATKVTTANGYDIYYKVERAGRNIETIPGTVPYQADGVQTIYYDILTHKDGDLFAHTDGKTTGAVEVYENALTLSADYVGPVALPVVNRYKVSWNFYEEGESNVAAWCAKCKDKGTVSESLDHHTKWDADTIADISRISAKNTPCRQLWEVPRLNGLSCIKWQDGYKYYRWGTIRGGSSLTPGSSALYRAGLGNTIPFIGENAMPYIVTGFTGYNSIELLSYACIVQGSSSTTDQALSIGTCVLAGDMGLTNKGTAVERETYMPLRVGYNNNLQQWTAKESPGDGVETIVRRIHEIRVQNDFKFFS